MLKKLEVRNFRSLRDVSIDFGKFNVFVGQNNSGKSNIMRALNLILGLSYPSEYSFGPEDFFNYDNNQTIEITAFFDEEICNIDDTSGCGFRLTFSEEEGLKYVVIDKDGNPLSYRSGKEVRVNKEMREKVNLMYIGLDREASQQLRTSTWTLYGKLLKYLSDKVEKVDRNKFEAQVKEAYRTYIANYGCDELEDILRKHIQEQTGLGMGLRLSTINPLEVLKGLRPYFFDEPPADSLEWDADDVGTGIQSALAIGIARAYAKIVKKALIIAIEEPELYLHPHGCRHFYHLLRTMSCPKNEERISEEERLQVIYTTHERSFVNIADAEDINIVRKEKGETKVSQGRGLVAKSWWKNGKERLKIVSKFDEEKNEAFFANAVILVEGPGDKIACQSSLEELGVDIDKYNISIISADGYKNMPQLVNLLKHFQIRTYVLMDEDPENEETQKIREKLKALLEEDYIFLQRPWLERMLGIEERLGKDGKLHKDDALELFPAYYRSGNKPPAVYEELKEKLKKDGILKG
jgi:putative ATP-dependent endonuclease of OLD family